MIKIMIVCLALLSLLVLSGCNTKTETAYFDMGCGESYDTCNKQIECNNICDNSGIRISNHEHNNKVMFEEGNFICKCL